MSLEEAANKPKAVSQDGRSITMPSPAEQIELDRYMSSKKARRNPFGAVKIAQTKGNSAVV